VIVREKIMFRTGSKVRITIRHFYNKVFKALVYLALVSIASGPANAAREVDRSFIALIQMRVELDFDADGQVRTCAPDAGHAANRFKEEACRVAKEGVADAEKPSVPPLKNRRVGVKANFEMPVSVPEPFAAAQAAIAKGDYTLLSVDDYNYDYRFGGVRCLVRPDAIKNLQQMLGLQGLNPTGAIAALDEANFKKGAVLFQEYVEGYNRIVIASKDYPDPDICATVGSGPEHPNEHANLVRALAKVTPPDDGSLRSAIRRGDIAAVRKRSALASANDFFRYDNFRENSIDWATLKGNKSIIQLVSDRLIQLDAAKKDYWKTYIAINVLAHHQQSPDLVEWVTKSSLPSLFEMSDNNWAIDLAGIGEAGNMTAGKALVDALYADPRSSPRPVLMGSYRTLGDDEYDRSRPFPALVNYALNHPQLARMCNERSVVPDREVECGGLISFFSRFLDVKSLGRLLNRLHHPQTTRHQILVDAIVNRDAEKVRLLAAYPLDPNSKDFQGLNEVWQKSEPLYAGKIEPTFSSPDKAKEGWPLVRVQFPPRPVPAPDSWKLSNFCSVSAAENAKCVEIRSILASMKMPKDKLPSLAPPLCPYPTDGSGACNNPERYRAR
jgi:hypothetical protein